MKLLILVLALCVGVGADVYIHNPRGSNNRLKSNQRDRQNANRLFDSQNNARGGYNVGPELTYYAGSLLDIEWTNQHSCGHENNNCEIIIQYMCSANVRDGSSNDKKNSRTGNQCRNKRNRDCNTDTGYGMQEEHDYYLKCRNRERNKGLFTADQELENDDARHTRQNAGGNRHGYECAEEKDYYPYWHPTPWKDIVVMTNDVSRCPYYLAESENVKGRGHCVFDYPDVDVLLVYSKNGKFGNEPLPNTEEECVQVTHTARVNRQDVVYHASWKVEDSHGLSQPDCIESPWSRDNHHGNGVQEDNEGYPNRYRWEIPDNIPEDHACVIRLRYNISTDDFERWDTYSDSNNDDDNGISVIETNPAVQIFPDINFELNLAINTAQFGRTFQDRTHRFYVNPSVVANCYNIHNVNVRGKRGNLQQVYPATEYDFVPNVLHAVVGDCVHYQWTGADTNPRNNAGNGPKGKDRSNLIMLDNKEWGSSVTDASHLARNWPVNVANSSFLGLSDYMEYKLALDALGDAYFNLDPFQLQTAGLTHFMSSRNNQFTNRAQKASVMVHSAGKKRGQKSEDIMEERLLEILKELQELE